ncbi:MAG: electron transport complex subunit RsxC [Bryobacteraceae bacterium]|nr:electron transport complex subunit RsxC [Bryobacteraceae bacterium]MDW8379504.1 electron transport complex subunit RsxC [Bryobacterales bacterium]
MKLFGWFGDKALHRGVHVPECKEQTAHLPIRRMNFPPVVIVPMSQHAGTPAIPIVKEGQEVVRGEPIARPDGFVSVPMHAPVTGKVERIALAPSARGDLSLAIYIRPYPAASQEVLYGEPQNIDQMSPEEIVRAVQETGVVGLGGAAFPTHVKMKLPEGRTVDTVVVNGCECEPYLTTDHRVMVEQPRAVIHGTRIAMKALGAPRAIIGVEDNKPDAIQALRDALAAESAITVEAVPTKYPQGAEKMLIEVLLGREVPSGGLPSEVGVAVFNVATLAQIGDLLPRRQGLIERVITIAGTAVRKPGNYLTVLGTPIRWALEQAGATEQAASVILGGPMMGPTISSLDVPITKGVTGILVMARDSFNSRHTIFPCIRCGACVEVCPLHLNPSRLGMLARKGRYEEMESDFHLMDCFECGCCSYVCPSHIPLVQYFRVAKQMNRERKARHAAASA